MRGHFWGQLMHRRRESQTGHRKPFYLVTLKIMTRFEAERKVLKIKIGPDSKLDLIKPGYYQQIVKFLKQLLGTFSITIPKTSFVSYKNVYFLIIFL